MISGISPTFVAMTGRPLAKASRNTIGEASVRSEAITIMSHAA
jgi:hypothetical protein